METAKEKRRSVWDLVVPERPTQTKVFTDPEQPDYELEITLRGLDGQTGLKATDIFFEHSEKYVTGPLDDNGQPKKSEDGKVIGPQFKLVLPKPVPGYQLDERMCRLYGRFAAMWAGDRRVPSLVEFVGWQLMLPTAFFQILAFMEETNSPRALQGNAPGRTTNESSDESSDTITNTPQ